MFKRTTKDITKIALEKYPVKMSTYNDFLSLYEGMEKDFIDENEKERKAFIKGYLQAEQDYNP